MHARLALAALVVPALLAAGCGGDAKRSAVADYLKQVNAVEKQLAVPLAAVTKANRALGGRHPKLGAVHSDLVRAQARTRAARAKLAALEPPADARKLQGLLLELVDRQVELTGETAKLALFLPRFDASRQPLHAAAATLQRRLGSKHAGTAAKAAALDTYAGVVGRTVAALRTLDPPPVSRPAYRAQVDALVRVGATARALAGGLRTKRSDIARLLHDFDAASVATASTASQQAQIAAVQAYNRRIRSIDSLLRKIAFEEARLGKTT